MREEASVEPNHFRIRKLQQLRNAREREEGRVMAVQDVGMPIAEADNLECGEPLSALFDLFHYIL